MGGMDGAQNARPLSRVFLWSALAAAAATVALAPIVGGGWCGDATFGGTSVCVSYQRSVVGIDSNVWIWLAALLVVAIWTLVVLLRRRPPARQP